MIAASAYLAYLAGVELFKRLGSIDEDLEAAGNRFLSSFEGAVTEEPIVFEDPPTRLDSDSDEITFTPTGGNTNFDPDANPTPFRNRQDGVVLEGNSTSESEIVFVSPDFSIFEQSGSSSSQEITILE